MTANHPTVHALGYAGLIPFIVFALILWQPSLVPDIVAKTATSLGKEGGLRGFLGYSAVILSFLGGVFWGQALQLRVDAKTTLLLIVSNLFALIAWLALLLETPLNSLALLSAGYLSLLALEWRLSGQHPKLPQWSLTSYLPMRIVLTAVVVVLHFLVMAYVIKNIN